MATKPKVYRQGKPEPWAKKLYSVKKPKDKNQTMAMSGCGATAGAIVAATMVDPKITPWDIAQLFMAKGFRTKNNGTLFSAFKWLFKRYKGKGIRKFAAGKGKKNMMKALDQGAYLVCNMGKGYWTKNGHYIVVWKYDDKYFYAVDPASAKRTKQEIGQFTKECKRVAAFYP